MPVSEESITAIELVDPLVGTVFDKRFRVDERLAAGGFGAIYKATHIKSGHQIALKVLHPTLASDLGVLARFRREGTTLTSLRNPHTITAYEFGQVDKTLFIVLELLRGETLFDRYSVDGPMEWKRVVHISKQVCESLEEAHAQGIVHRDLKPTNIHLEVLAGDPDYVKVLDFGIAKILRGSEHDSQDITNAGQMIGTLDYMSPEQMVGGQVTGQTDIYTLGILMYEMIAGTRPFPESETAGAALAAMLKTTPEPLYLRAPVPRELDAIVMRCLERETQKRYRSVGELRGDLERMVKDGVSATTATVLLRPNIDDNDETTVTPPPERILESTRGAQTPSMETIDMQRTPRVDRADSARTPRFERPTPLAEWEDEDERAPTTTRRPDGGDDSVPEANASRTPSSPIPSLVARAPSSPSPVARVSSSVKSSPSMPAVPPLRPLESRHVATPVPQVVVAPFSQSPRTPPPNDPRMRSPTGQMPPMGMEPRAPTTIGSPPAPGLRSPTPGAFPGLPPTPVPHVIPTTPPMFAPYGAQSPPQSRPPTAGYDMSTLAARDTVIRRLVWIVVLVVAAGLGFLIAMQL